MWKSIDEAYAAAQLEAAGQGRASEGIAKYQNARRSIEITKLGVTAAGKRDAEQVVDKYKGTADNMPFDIAHIIVQFLDPSTGTSLGLTCRNWYHHLKANHTGPTPLSYRLKDSDPYLGQKIASWTGFQQYRFSTEAKILKFLNIEVYGNNNIENPAASNAEEVNSNYTALFYRVRDYHNTYKLAWRFCPNRPDVQEYVLHARLPNPLDGNGCNWYKAAFKIIEKSIHTSKSIQAWEDSWKEVMVFQEHLDQFFAVP